MDVSVQAAVSGSSGLLRAPSFFFLRGNFQFHSLQVVVVARGFSNHCDTSWNQPLNFGGLAFGKPFPTALLSRDPDLSRKPP